MNTKATALALIATVASLLPTTATLAHPCTDIASVPITISAPGRYCLTRNLIYMGQAAIGTAESAILILSDDVTVDFDNHTLQGDANAAANPNAAAVRADDRNNVTVKNGAVRNIGLGVSLSDVSGGITPIGYVVERMLVDGVQSYGILVNSQHAIVKDNRVANLVYARTLTTPAGISVSGTAAKVVGNTVSNVRSSITPAFGIYLNAPASIVQNNSISNIDSIRSSAFGITLGVATSGSAIKDNVIQSAVSTTDTGITAVSGTSNVMIDNNAISGFFYAVNLSGSTNSKFRNNTAIGTGSANPYYGGINIGGNN
jgi:hypothetical protein